tara:strand:- start:197 stop:871 length:675 start_codon:yes stop_codon:yes gene_type:complete
MKILIIEDEQAIVELVTFSLNKYGWSIDFAHNTLDAWQYLQNNRPQLILLDWMLPDKSGLKLLTRIRSDINFASIPVIMLTAKSMEEDKIAGLDHGADDYITKPFSPRELHARIKAVIRRKSPENVQEEVCIGSITLDPESFRVSVNGKQIEIGHSEFKLLKFLIANPERVFSRNHLLDKVWGDHAVLEERTVDVHILRLRKALGKASSYIKTVRSVGYLLSEK